MKKILSSLVITIFLSSCAVEKEKLTENVGKYVPPNIDDTNFKNSVITNKNFEETWTSVIDFVDDSFFKIENRGPSFVKIFISNNGIFKIGIVNIWWNIFTNIFCKFFFF